MSKTVGYIYLVLTFVIWGSLYVAAKSVMAEIPSTAVLASRYAIAVVASSSKDGAFFEGAVGSTLFVDEIKIEWENK